MHLEESTFKNFRCFIDYRLSYGVEVTVFIGKNGTGKSSILSAIRRGLSFMFAKPNKFKRNLANSSNATVKSFGDFEVNFDQILRSTNYPIENSFIAIFNDGVLNWSFLKKGHRKNISTPQYAEALNKILTDFNKDPLILLPVLSVFEDSFPHILINFGSKVKKVLSQDILPRDFGYYGWDEKTNCIELWLFRFYLVRNYLYDIQNYVSQLEKEMGILESRMDFDSTFEKLNPLNNSLQEPEPKRLISDLKLKIETLKEKIEYFKNEKKYLNFATEKKFVENKIIEFSRPLDSNFDFINSNFEIERVEVVKLDGVKSTIEFWFKDNRRISYDALPMGFRRIFSMVIDIAYRSYILNEDKESKGIVMIDEIELHLHPSLQQEILQRFKKTFPSIQFIVTTHSPLVISNFKTNDKNRIIKLDFSANSYSNSLLQNIYGIDYNSGLMDVMGTNFRHSLINSLIDTIVILETREMTDQANMKRRELNNLVGADNKRIEDEITQRVNLNRSI